MPKHTTPHAAFQSAAPKGHSDRSNACSSGIQGVPVEALQPALVQETIEGLSSCLEYFRLYQEQAPKGFVSLDREGRIQEVNQAWLETTGFTRESVLQQPVHRFLTRRSWEVLAHHLKDPSLDKGFQEELELCTPTGSRLLMLVHGKVTGCHTNGRKAHCLFQDITQARMHQEKIQSLEQERTMFMDNMNEAVLFYDKDMQVVSANKTACDLFGLSLDQLQGKSCRDLFCVTPEYCRDCGAQSVLSSGGRHEEQVQDDRGRWWLMRFFPALDHQGEVQGTVQLALDITESKQAEETLRESETRYRTIFEHAGDAIFVHDMEGRLLDVNRLACESLGYAREELLRMSLSDIYSDEHRALVPQRIQIIRDKGALSFETVRIARNGTAIPYGVNARLIDFRGRPAVLSIGRDLREIREAMQRKQHLEEQLRQSQKMEALGKMAGGVAHDFNNLLQAAMGYLELLLLQKPERDPDREILDKVAVALERGRELVQSLLAFGRKNKTKLQPVRLEEVIGDTLSLLGRTLPKSLVVSTESTGALPAVTGDPHLLGQVVMNLVHNASDAMDGTGQVKLHLEAMSLGVECQERYLDLKPGEYVTLAVTDSGPGMDQATRARIFEPFFTTKPSGKGTGLGLSIVYGIVKNHGGLITCYSEPGRGTIFRLYLPVAGDRPQETQPEETLLPMKRCTGTVLLVDDEQAIREVARAMLERAGLQVLTAGSGEEALTVCIDRGQDIDVVILDLGMPGMGGERCLQEIRRLGIDVRVILSSGYGGSRLADNPRSHGAEDFLIKPYRSDMLINTIQQVLDRRGSV